MRTWTKLNIGGIIHDKAGAILPDHVGKILQCLDEGTTDNSRYEVEFYSGRVETCLRKDIGPLECDPFYQRPPIELWDEMGHWCFTCKQCVNPEIIYYNIFGLPRGLCPVCGEYGVVLNYKPKWL